MPAESTASPSGFSLQYFVETRDARGPLLTVGSEAAPLVVEVLPGQVPAQVFKPVPKAVFFGAVGVTGASALAVAGLSVALNLTQSRYQTLANGPAPHTVFDTEALVGLGRTGSALAVATNVALVAVSVSMLTTLILGILTKFDE